MTDRSGAQPLRPGRLRGAKPVSIGFFFAFRGHRPPRPRSLHAPPLYCVAKQPVVAKKSFAPQRSEPAAAGGAVILTSTSCVEFHVHGTQLHRSPIECTS
eukprot:493337-Prymnesium_polylepis.1